MKNLFRPSEIPALRTSTMLQNPGNAGNFPAVNLGSCTPFLLFDSAGFSSTGTVCIMGNPSKGIGLAKAMLRRSRKPFLFLGPASDSNSVFNSLKPEWELSSPQENLPDGNGAVFIENPYRMHSDFCYWLEGWEQKYTVLLHLGTGLQIGREELNILSSGHTILFCENVPQSLRGDKNGGIAPLEFMKQMHYLVVFSSGAETAELISLLPKYQYEKITNTTGINTYNSHSVFNPFHIHLGRGYSANQSRTIEFKKDIFEMDDLQRLFGAGYTLVYNAGLNKVFVCRLC